jgi:hypothetical protein
MGNNITDTLANANQNLIDVHSKPRKEHSNATFLYKNQLGYPVYDVDGKKMIQLGFFVSEGKFAEYYQVAKEINETGMRKQEGNGQVLNQPNVNNLLHYSLDFFCNNFRLTKSLKPKDVLDLSKMLIKQMPGFMRK